MLLSPRISTDRLNEVASSTPTVLVGRRARERALDCVVNDDFGGAAMAVEHLAGLGHRRIAHLSGGKGAGAADRRRGYERTMSRLGLERHVLVAPGEYTEEKAATVVRKGFWPKKCVPPPCSPPTTSRPWEHSPR